MTGSSGQESAAKDVAASGKSAVDRTETPASRRSAVDRDAATADAVRPSGNGRPHLIPKLAPYPGADEDAQRLCERVAWERFLPDAAEGSGWRFRRGLKRVVERVVAAVGLVVLSPLLASVALAILLTTGRPVLYRMRALGRRGELINVLKFRTMVPDARARKAELLDQNEMEGAAFKMREDPRVTPLGRFLRKYSIDELPQLWNVLRGDMSLVGPRPPLPEEFLVYEPWQRGRLALTPGITCTWQVEGRTEIGDFDEWARMDLDYIENWSLTRDLVILLRTVPAVFRAKGAY